MYVCDYTFFLIQEGTKEGKKDSGGSGLRSVLDNLPEIWSEEQYSNEYDLTSFVKSLATSSNV